MQMLFFLCSSLSLVGGTTSPLFSAHASKTLRTSSAHSPSAKRHFRCICTQHRSTGPGYVAFSYENDIEGAFRTPVHAIISSGISTGAVILVVGELISVQAAGNQSNRGRPKNKRHDPNPLPPQTKMRRKQKTPYVSLYN